MSKIEFLSPPSSVSMADEWFDLATTDHFWIEWRHSVLLRQLNRARFRGKIALEVGCGHGLVREMLERDRGIRVDGCDLNQHALEKATSGKGRLLVYDVFDRNSEMLGAYDLLLLMDVIEHIDDDLEFVKVSLQHLKPDGLVVINVPAHMNFYSQYDEVAGHKRRYGVADIKSLFRQARLKPISIAQWGLFLLPALLMRKLILRLTPPEHTISVGFVPSNPFLHGILKRLQALETSIPFSMPIGSSLLAVGRRMSDAST